MTVAAGRTPEHSYFPGSAMAAEAIPFEFLDAAHLHVVISGTDTTVSESDYSIAGDGMALAGTITALVAVDSDVEWTVYSDTPDEQQLDLAATRVMPMAQYERELDRRALVSREARQTFGRAPLVPRGESAPAFASLADLEDGDLLEFRGGKLGPFDPAPFAGMFYAGDGTGRPVPASGLAGGDTALRSDLASALAGALLIAAATGGTVEEAIWHKGRVTAIAASKAKVNWLRDDAADPLENVAGLWSAPILIDNGLNKTFGAAFGAVGAPVSTLFVKAKNTGTVADVVAGMFFAEVASEGGTVFGANIGAYSSGGVNNYKLVGLEIDVQPQAGTTMLQGGGLYINGFTSEIPGNAIYIEGVFGGCFATGIRIGKLNSAIGAGIYGAGEMGVLVDTATGIYGQDAICVTHLHATRYRTSSGNPCRLFVDASNIFHFVLPAGGLAFRDNTDSQTLMSVQNIGSEGVVNIETGAGEYRIDGTKVLGARDTGWAAMTGSPNKASVYDTATVTLPQLAGRVKYMQDVMALHGQIGT